MRDVALGFGGCLDYEVVWSQDDIQRWINAAGVRYGDLDTEGPVRDSRELLGFLLHHVREGTGCEVGVANQLLVAEMCDRLSGSVSLGGTSVRAAVALATLGVPVKLDMGTWNHHTARLLPTCVEVFHDTASSRIEPHAIVQFPVGACFTVEESKIVCPRSNRVIFANDQANRELKISDKFLKLAPKAAIVSLSGFNAMTNPVQARERCQRIRRALDLGEKVIVLLEDAPYHNPCIRRVVLDELATTVDIFAMNEDELLADSGPTELSDAKEVSIQLDRIRARVGISTIVLHTRDWAVARGRLAEQCTGGLRLGADLAGVRYCIGGFPGIKELRALIAVGPKNNSKARIIEELDNLPDTVCIPSRRVSHTYHCTTIGLGDIFHAGLIAGLAAAAGILPSDDIPNYLAQRYV